MASDLSMVMGAATYKDLGQTYRMTTVDRSALDRIMELVSGVRVSAHVPGPVNQQAGRGNQAGREYQCGCSNLGRGDDNCRSGDTDG